MKIYTLTLCPAYDVHATADSFSCGRENLITVTSRDAGGKGVNISRALLAYGIESTAIILCGEDNSAEFIKAISECGINSSIISTEGRIRENITVHTSDGETRISLSPTPVSEGILEKVKKSLTADRGDIVTLTGRIPDGIPMSAVKKLVSELKRSGARVVIDSRSFTLSDIKECSPWLIKPNGEEISEYFGRDIESFEDAIECAEEIVLAGVENVIVSLGETGAILLTEDRILKATPPKIEPLSTVGAGDSMIAAFIAATANGYDKASALMQAVAFGSAACLTEGTSPPRIEDFKKIIKNIKLS